MINQNLVDWINQNNEKSLIYHPIRKYWMEKKAFGLLIGGVVLFYICIDQSIENELYHLPIIYISRMIPGFPVLKFALNHLDKFLFIHRYLSVLLIALVFIGSFIELNEEILVLFLSCIAIYISSSLLVFSHKAVETYT